MIVDNIQRGQASHLGCNVDVNVEMMAAFKKLQSVQSENEMLRKELTTIISEHNMMRHTDMNKAATGEQHETVKWDVFIMDKNGKTTRNETST